MSDHMDTWREGVPGKGTSKCEGPEVGGHQDCLKLTCSERGRATTQHPEQRRDLNPLTSDQAPSGCSGETGLGGGPGGGH